MPKKHSRPITILRTVAAQWGWRALRRFTHQLPAESQFDERLVTWYESGIATGTPRDLFLQINEYPIGQKVVYSAAVYAPRFRLNSLWHVFKLPGGGLRVTAAASLSYATGCIATILHLKRRERLIA